MFKRTSSNVTCRPLLGLYDVRLTQYTVHEFEKAKREQIQRRMQSCRCARFGGGGGGGSGTPNLSS
jgi:hypothetical protein